MFDQSVIETALPRTVEAVNPLLFIVWKTDGNWNF
jgi:hypothetical protein